MTQAAPKSLTTAEAERHDAWERFLANKSDPQRVEKYHAALRAITKMEQHHD